MLFVINVGIFFRTLDFTTAVHDYSNQGQQQVLEIVLNYCTQDTSFTLFICQNLVRNKLTTSLCSFGNKKEQNFHFLYMQIITKAGFNRKVLQFRNVIVSSIM